MLLPSSTAVTSWWRSPRPEGGISSCPPPSPPWCRRRSSRGWPGPASSRSCTRTTSASVWPRGCRTGRWWPSTVSATRFRPSSTSPGSSSGIYWGARSTPRDGTAGSSRDKRPPSTPRRPSTANASTRRCRATGRRRGRRSGAQPAPILQPNFARQAAPAPAPSAAGPATQAPRQGGAPAQPPAQPPAQAQQPPAPQAQPAPGAINPAARMRPGLPQQAQEEQARQQQERAAREQRDQQERTAHEAVHPLGENQ